jgi:hypothetical protein
MAEQTQRRISTSNEESVFAPDGVTLVAERTETADGASADIDTRGFNALTAYLEVTAFGGTTPTLDVIVEGKDPVSGAYHAIPGAAFAQVLGAVSSQRLAIALGIVAAANLAVNQPLPRTIRFSWTITGSAGQTYTFTIGGDYHRV